MLHKAGFVCGVTQTSGTVGVLTKVKIHTGDRLNTLDIRGQRGGQS